MSGNIITKTYISFWACLLISKLQPKVHRIVEVKSNQGLLFLRFLHQESIRAIIKYVYCILGHLCQLYANHGQHSAPGKVWFT